VNNERFLLVISGPSGIGKDTVVGKIMSTYPNFELSVSVTTRKPRNYEINGEHYYFTSEMEFLRRVKAGEFIEYAQYAGNYYGTLKSEVDKRINKGIYCILVIEVNGCQNVKALYPGCTTVFLLAPNPQEHERRLRERACETEKDMAKRLEIAKEEMKLADNYDFCVVNKDVEECAKEIYSIVRQQTV
jgi:guanylate kinase